MTPRQTCPWRIRLGRNLRSKTRWFTGFCNSHQVSHFATFFIDARTKISVAESRFTLISHALIAHHQRTEDFRSPSFLSLAQDRRLGGFWKHRCFSLENNKFTVILGLVNDPSAGSPTETLLRLLLPLNDKVQWTSHDVAGGEPPTSPRSEHFTGPFNR